MLTLEQLEDFKSKTEAFKLLKSSARGALSQATKSLIILDSSFNPPHSAHLALLRRALRTKIQEPAAIILLLAIQNADKISDPVEYPRRVRLMEAFAKTVSGLCETRIGIVKHPYFVDKFKAIREEYPKARQIYLVGYDTFLRILDKSYYPEQDLSKSGLAEFFLNGKLLCACREGEKWGSASEQETYMKNLAAGKVDGVPSEWAKNIEIVMLEGDEGKDVSSTRIREAVQARDEKTLSKFLTPDVQDVVKAENMYMNIENDKKVISCTRDHVMNCCFSAWYHKFRSITPKARIIRPLPRSFVDYLNEDGLMLPQDSTTVGHGYIDEIDSGNESELSDEGFSEEDPTATFKELHDEIESIISELGGSVVPKLNWSSPRDAIWISADKTMRCTSPSDIYLLLKSSDFIAHDLNHAFDNCEESTESMRPENFELVLKEWFALQPSMEFRCFVRDRTLIGISQRDMNYYDFLDAMSSQILTLAMQMFQDYVRDGFTDPNFVFDIYVSSTKNKAWLTDINPYSTTTDSLLFEWSEIQDKLSVDKPELRLVSSDSVMTHGPQFSSHQVPYDLIDSSDGLDVAEFARTFQQKLARAAI